MFNCVGGKRLGEKRVDIKSGKYEIIRDVYSTVNNQNTPLHSSLNRIDIVEKFDIK